MPFIPAPTRTIRIAWEGSLRGEQVINTMYATRDAADPLDQAMANDVFADFRDSFVGATAPYNLSNLFILQRAILTDVTVQNGPQVVSNTAPAAGLTTGQCLPNEVAACITWRTGFSGRSFRGRMYLAGIPVSHVQTDMNRLGSAFVTSLNNGAAALIGNLLSSGLTAVIASYQSNKLPRAIAVTTNILSGVANERVDSQRRRMPRS